MRAHFTGVEINGDALKARLLRKVRRLEEQQARAWRPEHRAVPAILCDTGWLKRCLSVEASVTDGTHLEIRRGGVLDVSMALAELRISRISRADRVFGFVPHEHAELGKHSQSQCLSTFVLL